MVEGPVIPTCAGAPRGPRPRPAGPCAGSGRWPPSRSVASSARRPPLPGTARCGGGWPYSGRRLSGRAPETAPEAPTRGPASGPAGWSAGQMGSCAGRAGGLQSSSHLGRRKTPWWREGVDTSESEKSVRCSLCLTLHDPMEYSPPGSSVHGILQARTLEWVTIPFSRGSSQPRDQTPVSCTAGRFFTVWATR